MMAKKKPKRRASKPRKLPVKQGEYESEVGNGKPPKEFQFKPGESGNPKGPPKRSVQLWTYICRYMALSESGLKKLDAKNLTYAQQWALKTVKSAKKLGFAKLDRFSRYVIDRDEGNPTEHVLIGDTEDLTDGECDQIREVLLRNHAD